MTTTSPLALADHVNPIDIDQSGEAVFEPFNDVDPVTQPDEWYLEYLKMTVRAKAYATRGTTPRVVRHWQDLAVALVALTGRGVPIPAGKAALTRDWLLDAMTALNEAPIPCLTEDEWAARYDHIPTDLDLGKHSFAAYCVDQIDMLVYGALVDGCITEEAGARLLAYTTTTINRLGVAE